MSTPIGDAVVKVRIDTTDAKATLDRQDAQHRTIGWERSQGRRLEDDEDGGSRRRRRRRVAPPPGSAAAAARAGGAPVRGMGLAALALLVTTYGPAAMEGIKTALDDAAKGADPVSAAALKALKGVVDWQQGNLEALSEAVAHITQFLTSVFGSLEDTTAIARASILFQGKADLGELVEFFLAQQAILKAQGMGKWAGREIVRRELGKGFARSLTDLVKTQE